MNQERRDSRQQPLKVGLYDIEHTIGKGNFAVVKLAKHRITKTPVAIKIIDKSQLDEANLKKVHREVQIMKLLRHPNILKLYQVMETDNMLYLVTEFATNGEMFAYIDKNGKLPENEARRVFRQILSAVDHCHRRRVVHRDLKTENVLLDENLNIKIADFGFGNYFEDSELLRTFCGSPPYAAPEVFEGKLYDGPAVDAWSLGVVLYVLVCAALPFDGTKLHEVRDRVLEGRYRVPYFMSSELEDLIKRILVKNPQQRYTLEQIKNHPWMLRGDDGSDHVTIPDPLTDRDLLIESAVDKGIHGEFNAQVLALMKELKIDEEKTKLAVMRNSYDHHSAIYYLLLERLKQHRSSYPERSQTSTRLRRASVTADQIVVQNGVVQKIVMPTATSMPQPIPKWTPLQYALRDLHLGEVAVPQDMQAVGPGLGVEMRPVTTVSASTSAVSTAAASVSCPAAKPSVSSSLRSRGGLCVMGGTVSETIDEDMDESTELRGTRQAEEARPRRRRAAIQPMPSAVHPMSGSTPQDTLYVPANHPLLRQNTGGRHSNASDISTMDEDSDDASAPSMGEAHGFKIQIIPPVEPSPPSSNSRFQQTAQPPKNTRLSMTLSPRNFTAFTEGRRASDGNSTNAPFRQLLRKSDVQSDLQGSDAMEVMMLQCEHQELQQLYRRSLTPDEVRQQQMQHSLFMEKLDERIGFVPIGSTTHGGSQRQLQTSQHQHYPDFRSNGNLFAPMNFDLTDPMQHLHIHTSQHLGSTTSADFNGSAENNNTLGPFRRQASYRKLANSPILHHSRGGSYKRSSTQRLPAGLLDSDNNSPYSSFELEAGWHSTS